MPQGLGKNLDPTLSVFENVDFFGRLFGLARQQRERPDRTSCCAAPGSTLSLTVRQASCRAA